MLIARKLMLAPMCLLYFGRIGTVIGYVILGYATIRILPILKWPMAVALTSPINLFLAGSLSADAVTIGLCCLACAIVLKGIVGPGGLGRKFACGLIVVMVAVSLSKSAYMPLALSPLAIPASKWKSQRYAWLSPVAVLVASIAAAAAWSHVIHPLGVQLKGDDPSMQLAWVVHHPLQFLKISVSTLGLHLGALTYSAVGILGWLDASMLVPFMDLFIFSIALLALAYDEPIPLGFRPRLVFASSAGASVLSICLAVFLVWDKIGAPQIEGLQGRYFLPLLIPILVVVRQPGSYVVQQRWVAVLMLLTSAYTVFTLVRRYYI